MHHARINELLLLQFYVFNIRPKLHRRKLRKLRFTLPVNRRNMHALFSVCRLRDDNVITSTPAWKLKYTNSILESFEYICQISSKLIVIILNYTVSNFVHFYWDTVYFPGLCTSVACSLFLSAVLSCKGWQIMLKGFSNDKHFWLAKSRHGSQQKKDAS